MKANVDPMSAKALLNPPKIHAIDGLRPNLIIHNPPARAAIPPKVLPKKLSWDNPAMELNRGKRAVDVSITPSEASLLDAKRAAMKYIPKRDLGSTWKDIERVEVARQGIKQFEKNAKKIDRLQTSMWDPDRGAFQLSGAVKTAPSTFHNAS